LPYGNDLAESLRSSSRASSSPVRDPITGASTLMLRGDGNQLFLEFPLPSRHLGALLGTRPSFDIQFIPDIINTLAFSMARRLQFLLRLFQFFAKALDLALQFLLSFILSGQIFIELLERFLILLITRPEAAFRLMHNLPQFLTLLLQGFDIHNQSSILFPLD
jgi:hypothetical protein